MLCACASARRSDACSASDSACCASASASSSRRRRCAFRLLSATMRAARAGPGSVRSASSNERSASSHSPRRSWRRPIRCSTAPSSLRPGERRRRLVTVEGEAVLTGKCLEIPDRLVERGRIVVAERERFAERRESFRVRVEVARVLARMPVGGRRLAVAAGEPQVLRDRARESFAGVARGERFGRATVQQSSPSRARQVVRDAPGLFVAECKLPAAALGQEPTPRQLLEGGDRLLLASPAHRADQVSGRTAARGRPRPRQPDPQLRSSRVTRASSRPRHAGRQSQSEEPSGCESRYSTTKNGSPCVSSNSRSESSAEAPAAAASSATPSRSSRSGTTTLPSPSRIASARMRRAGWSAGVSSVRQVASTRTGRSRSRRTRKASSSSEEASAQCTSSTTSSPGRSPPVASTRTRATPSRKRACAPGPSSVGVGGVPSSGTSRAASAAACRIRPLRRLPRGGRFARARSSNRTRARIRPRCSEPWLRRRRRCARAPASSSASRVLPIPVSPSSTTRRPSVPTRAYASRRLASSRSRPTSA